MTTDIDVTPNRTHTNLARLAVPGHEVGGGGGIRVDDLDHGLAFDASPESLAGMLSLNLRTLHGDLDLTLNPTAPRATPTSSATPKTTASAPCTHVACLADVVRSKTAAGRPKDLQALPELLRSQRGQQANLED